MKQLCQKTMGEYRNYFECGKPAKAWIPDPFKRWRGGRQLLCGIHARAYDKIAKRFGRTTSSPL